MKIAVLMELDGGGARRGANEFSLALKQLGHEVNLHCVDTQLRETERTYYNRAFLWRFNPVQWKGHDWKSRLYRDTVELFNLFLLHRQIARELENKGYDLVLVHPSKFTQAPFLLSLTKLPTIYYCQEPLRLVYDPLFAIPTELSFPKKLYEIIIRVVRKHIDAVNIRSAQVVLANSRYTKQNIANAYGIDSQVCHMGVDTKRFYPTAKKSVDIVFIGTRDPFEGFPLFEESLKLMKYQPRVHYLIRGENWATNDAQLRRYYSRAEVVICFGFHEPFGLIPLEAMACGCTPLALNEGGYRDSVRHGTTGMLVKSNAKEVARVLDGLLSHKARLRMMQAEGIRVMNQYWSWGRGAKQIVAAYKKCTQNILAGEEDNFRKTLQRHSKAIAYGLIVVVCLLLFRLGFRLLRSRFVVMPELHGDAGYAQYTGYPLLFETYLFNAMFAIPIVLALVFKLFWRRKRYI